MLRWAALVSLWVLGTTALALRWLQRLRERRSSGKDIAVVVLGDLGRSPRMLYHAESLAARDWTVSLIGYEGAQLCAASWRFAAEPLRRGRFDDDAFLELTSREDTALGPALRDQLNVRPLRPLPATLAKLPRRFFLVLAPLKLFWAALSLAQAILSINALPRYILVQVRHVVGSSCDEPEPASTADTACPPARLPAHRLAAHRRLAQHRCLDPRSASR